METGPRYIGRKETLCPLILYSFIHARGRQRSPVRQSGVILAVVTIVSFKVFHYKLLTS